MMEKPTAEEVERSLGAPVRMESVEWTVDGVTLRVPVPVRTFNGRELMAGPDLERVELMAAHELVKRRHHGPEGLRFLRRTIGVSIVDFAGALGVNEKTVRRWELGEVVPDHASVAAYHRSVAERCEGRDPLEWLRLLDRPDTHPGDVIDVDAA